MRHIHEDAAGREILVRLRHSVPHPRRPTPGRQHAQKNNNRQNLQTAPTNSRKLESQVFSAGCSCRSRYSFKITAAATESTVTFDGAFFLFFAPADFSSRMTLPCVSSSNRSASQVVSRSSIISTGTPI